MVGEFSPEFPKRANSVDLSQQLPRSGRNTPHSNLTWLYHALLCLKKPVNLRCFSRMPVKLSPLTTNISHLPFPTPGNVFCITQHRVPRSQFQPNMRIRKGPPSLRISLTSKLPPSAYTNPPWSFPCLVNHGAEWHLFMPTGAMFPHTSSLSKLTDTWNAEDSVGPELAYEAACS